MIQKCSTCLFI